MIYLVTIEKSYQEAGYSDRDYNTVKYETAKYFDDIGALERYLLENNEKRYYDADVVKRVLKAEELKPVFKVSL